MELFPIVSGVNIMSYYSEESISNLSIYDTKYDKMDTFFPLDINK